MCFALILGVVEDYKIEGVQFNSKKKYRGRGKHREHMVAKVKVKSMSFLKSVTFLKSFGSVIYFFHKSHPVDTGNFTFTHFVCLFVG